MTRREGESDMGKHLSADDFKLLGKGRDATYAEFVQNHGGIEMVLRAAEMLVDAYEMDNAAAFLEGILEAGNNKKAATMILMAALVGYFSVLQHALTTKQN